MTRNIIYFDGNKEIEQLLGMTNAEVWKYINLDDWDYGLALEGRCAKKIRNMAIGDMLQGAYDNEWYEVKSKRTHKYYTIGMAYHS